MQEELLYTESPELLATPSEELQQTFISEEDLALHLTLSSDTMPTEEEFVTQLNSTTSLTDTEIARNKYQQETSRFYDSVMSNINRGDAEATDKSLVDLQRQETRKVNLEDYSKGLLEQLGIEWVIDSPTDEGAVKRSTALDRVARATAHFEETTKKMKEEKIPYVGAIIDWFGRMVPYANAYLLKESSQDLGFGEGNFFDPEATQYELATYLFESNISEEEFTRRLNEVTEIAIENSALIGTNPERFQELTSGFILPEKSGQNELLAFDAATSGLLKAGVLQTAKIINPKKTAEVTADAIKNLGEGVVSPSTRLYSDELEAVSDILPTHITNNPVSTPEHLTKTREILERLDEDATAILDEMNQSGFSSLEQQAAKDRILNNFDRDEIKVLDSERILDVTSSIPRLRVSVGDEAGELFTDPKVANDYAVNNYGFSEGEFNIVNWQGKYKITVDKPFSLRKDLKPLDKAFLDSQYIEPTPVLSLFQGSSNFLQGYMQYTKALGINDKVINDFFTPRAKVLSAVGREDTQRLATMFRNLQDSKDWLGSKEEMMAYYDSVGWKWKDEFWDAHEAARDVFDFAYITRNRALKRMLESEEFKTLDISNLALDTPEIIGKQIEDFNSLRRSNIYNAETGEYIPMENVTKDKLDKWLEEGYEAYTGKIPEEELHKVNKASVILAKKGTIKSSSLREDILAYKPYGSRIADEDYKVKVQLVGTSTKEITTDEGTVKTITTINKPRTIALAYDFAEGKLIKDNFEKIRGVYKRFESGELNLTQATQEIGALGIKGGKELLELFSTKGLDDSEIIDIARLDETLPAIKEIRKKAAGAMLEEESLIPNHILNELDSLGLYYGKRGKGAIDAIRGGYVKTLDPFNAATKSFTQALNQDTVTKVYDMSVARWIKQYNPEGFTKGDFVEAFEVPISTLNKNLNPKEVLEAITKRDSIRAMLNQQTSPARLIKASINSTMNSLAKQFPEADRVTQAILRAPYVGAPAKWALSKDYGQFAKGLTFHHIFGADPVQILLQTSQSAIMALAAPHKAPKLLRDVHYLMAARRSPHSEIRERLAKDVYEKGQVQSKTAMVDAFKRMGKAQLRGQQAYYDIEPNAKLLQHTMDKVIDKTRGASAYMFQYADHINQSMAFAKAWDEVGFDKIVKQRKLIDADYDKLEEAFQKWNLTLSSNRESFFQRGLAGVMTQFMSFPIRFGEAVLPKQLGGSPKYTGKQKAAIALSSAYLLGEESMPFYQDSLNFMAGMFPSAEESELVKFLRVGAYDKFFTQLVGAPTGFAARAGFWKNTREHVENILTGDSKLFHTLTGPSGGVLAPVLQDIYWSSEMIITSDAPTLDKVYGAWLNLSKSFSDNTGIGRTIRNYLDSEMVFQETGERRTVTSKGALGAPITKGLQISRVAGVGPAGDNILWDAFNDSLDEQGKSFTKGLPFSRSEVEKSYAEVIRLYHDTLRPDAEVLEMSQEEYEEYTNKYQALHTIADHMIKKIPEADRLTVVRKYDSTRPDYWEDTKFEEYLRRRREEQYKIINGINPEVDWSVVESMEAYENAIKEAE